MWRDSITGFLRSQRICSPSSSRHRQIRVGLRVQLFRLTRFTAGGTVERNGIFISVNCEKTITMVDAILGMKYKLQSSENFDDFMKALGVGLVTRKMGAAVSPVIDLQKDGEEYTFNSNSTFKNVVLKFKPGVEFDQDTPDGRKVKSVITVDGNTLHEVQKNADGTTTTIDRTFTPEECKMVMSIGDISSTRIYKVQA